MGHDSSICVADGENSNVTSLRTTFLPFLAIEWVSADSVVAAGHCLTPMLFRYTKSQDGGKLESLGKFEQDEQRKEQGGISAMRRFQSLDRHARVLNDEVKYFSQH